MKCKKCNKELIGDDAVCCRTCGGVYCRACNDGLCDCLGELRYFS